MPSGENSTGIVPPRRPSDPWKTGQRGERPFINNSRSHSCRCVRVTEGKAPDSCFRASARSGSARDQTRYHTAMGRDLERHRWWRLFFRMGKKTTAVGTAYGHARAICSLRTDDILDADHSIIPRWQTGAAIAGPSHPVALLSQAWPGLGRHRLGFLRRMVPSTGTGSMKLNTVFPSSVSRGIIARQQYTGIGLAGDHAIRQFRVACTVDVVGADSILFWKIDCTSRR